MEIKTGRWSESEVEKLNVMQECGFNIETMSMLLDRPKTSVYGKLWHMRKQNEITSFNVEDLPPKYDPDAKYPSMSDLIDRDDTDVEEESPAEFNDVNKYHNDILLMIRKSDLMINTLDGAYQDLKSVRRNNDRAISEIEANRLRIMDNDDKLYSISKSISWLAGMVAINAITLGVFAWTILS